MSRPLVAVVLAGGTGRRLYPASRSDRPKQFLSLTGEQSLIEQTLDRVAFADKRYVLTRAEYAAQIREIAPDVGVLTEPVPKDTGPALVYAASRIKEQIGDATLLCLPSDHRITDTSTGTFEQTATRAVGAAASRDALVTIGIEPTRPATEYGYIQPAPSDGSSPGEPVRQFVEKPDRSRAEEYTESGWYWNSGIFAWRPEALLSAATETPLEPLVDALAEGSPEAGFEAVAPVSVDNAVLETTTELFVVPGSFEWTDLGTWDGVARALGAEDSDTVTLTTTTESTGSVRAIDTTNCVLATDDRLSVVGAEDLVVASFGGHTVVVPRGQSDRVRDLTPPEES